MLNKGKNMIMSPLNTHIVLGIATYGAQGDTFNQMKKVLHLLDDDEFSQSKFTELLTQTYNMEMPTGKRVKIDPTVNYFLYKDKFGLLKLIDRNQTTIITLKLANKIYLAKGLKLKSKFRKSTCLSFHTDIEKL